MRARASKTKQRRIRKPAPRKKAPQIIDAQPVAQPVAGFHERMRTESAANYLGVAASTMVVWRCTKKVQIPYSKIGGRVVYSREDLDRFLQENKHGMSAAQ